MHWKFEGVLKSGALKSVYAALNEDGELVIVEENPSVTMANKILPKIETPKGY